MEPATYEETASKWCSLKWLSLKEGSIFEI